MFGPMFSLMFARVLQAAVLLCIVLALTLPQGAVLLLLLALVCGGLALALQLRAGGRAAPATLAVPTASLTSAAAELQAAAEQAREALLQAAAAEEASKAKSLFLANMSHEIRTPLTAIIGFSEVALDPRQSPGERDEAINTINRAGKHLLGIINDILDLSKIEAGRLQVESMAVPILPLVEEFSAMARLRAEGKGLYFHLEPEFPLPWTIQSDPLRIKQVLLNLVDNAIKFTERGGVTLRLRHHAENALLIIEVEDTGIGISPEQFGRLFQPFSQADASTTRRYGGTGLGLVLSKHLAEKLGGTLVAACLPGEGSRFFAAFASGETERMISSIEEAHALRPPVVAEAEAAQLAGKVLLAEDNPDNQRLAKMILGRLGVNLHIVENGEEAVAAGLTQTYDLILMDMQMPVMDGPTAVRVLRRDGYGGPIVALTANATPADIETCIEAGCDDFLSKPIDRVRFADVVRRYVPEATLPEAAAAVADTVPGRAAAPAPLAEQAPIVSELLAEGPEMQDLVTFFLGRLPVYEQTLRDALASADMEAIRKQAHDLKSVGGGYGFPQVMALAIELEASAKTAAAADVQRLVAAFHALARRIEAGAKA